MKKRTLWIVLLCLALMLSGCGAGTEAGLEQERLADTSGTAAQVEQAEAPPSMVKSRRYPMTRVRRLLLCAALGLTEDGLNLEILYVRALAMDGAGRRGRTTASALTRVTPSGKRTEPITI